MNAKLGALTRLDSGRVSAPRNGRVSAPRFAFILARGLLILHSVSESLSQTPVVLIFDGGRGRSRFDVADNEF
jgi:hypothetical protein